MSTSKTIIELLHGKRSRECVRYLVCQLGSKLISNAFFNSRTHLTVNFMYVPNFFVCVFI